MGYAASLRSARSAIIGGEDPYLIPDWCCILLAYELSQHM